MDLSRAKNTNNVSDWVVEQVGLDCSASGLMTSIVLLDSVNITKVSLDTTAWPSCDLDPVEP